jgi:hypothetical protein
VRQKKKIELTHFIESPEGQELAVLCLDYGYKLAGSPSDLTRDQINFLFGALVNRIEKLAAARTGQPGVSKFVFVDDAGGEE